MVVPLKLDTWLLPIRIQALLKSFVEKEMQRIAMIRQSS